MTACLVVDAAAIGVPFAEWQGFTARQRNAIIREHNARAPRK